VPATDDESPEPLSLLQKQLILSQVQILELEDVRDELQATIDQRTKILGELQSAADRAFLEAQQSRADETRAQQALAASREEQHQLQRTVESLREEIATTARRLSEVQATWRDAQVVTAAQSARIETLDAELRKMKASRTWRWTAPLRSLGRWLRRS
jgi:chromosome segregation ATPase